MSKRASSLVAAVREDLFAASLELVGTALFLLLGLGGIQGASANSATSLPLDQIHIIYISACMSSSLLISAWIFFRITGGLFNPQVSFALMLVGVITPFRFVLYVIAQLAGAIAASGLVLALTPHKATFKWARFHFYNSAVFF